jgi:hypothetical protein
MAASSQREPIHLQPRFGEIKRRIMAANTSAIVASWHRLLQELRREIDMISASATSELIASIDFADLFNPSSRSLREEFSRKLQCRGVAVIRGVVPRETARRWKKDFEEYLSENPQTRISTAHHIDRRHRLYELFWSPTQIQARAHPNFLAAQKFAMSHWHCRPQQAGGTSESTPLVSTAFPISYADRILVQNSDPSTLASPASHVDNGSVERWETDGYGRAGTYERIFAGRWEEHDPWDATARANAAPDLYGGVGRCSLFRMFQGWLSLGGNDSHGDYEEDEGGGRERTEGAGLEVVPLLKASTAYFLLRPFFHPGVSMSTYDRFHLSPATKMEAFLSETNWTMIPPDHQTSILHGALPSYTQELNDLLHPHLDLSRSTKSIPALHPGDYLLWHPDTIHAVAGGDSTMLYLPAVPLTQTNALYLARQRKAFLLGHPGPDFGSGGSRGESYHVGRPGVQEVNEAGGEDALKAMGLLPWEDDDGMTERDREVLAMANGILFPDRFGTI